MDLDEAKIITLPTESDQRGKLTFVEGSTHIPFTITRIYYLYGVPKGKTRGGHAHKETEQVMIAVSGSLVLTLDNGKGKKGTLLLKEPNEGVYIPKMMWREMSHFSDDSVCLVLASTMYNETDYIRNYDTFLESVKNERD